MLAVMEGTRLRSVAAGVPGPANPVLAVAEVERVLPGLRPDAQRALALVDLGSASRDEAGAELGLSAAELSSLLAAARKALRRTVAPLPAGGWCERAERLISDRIDGALTPTGATRLDAHLRSCQRCRTHEQRLVQAHDRLVAAYLEAHAPAPALVSAAPPAAELRVVEATESEAKVSPRVWHAAFVLGVLLVVAGVVLALLAVSGAL